MIKVFVIFVLIFSIWGIFLLQQKDSEDQEISSQSVKNINQKESEMSEISIITLYDNYQHDQSLKTGWGFSCLVKMPDQNLLFDTGDDSSTLLFNMEKLGIVPEAINTIILSHIHHDHTGGLEGFLGKNSQVKIYLPASFPSSFKEKSTSYGAEIIGIKESKEIFTDVWTTGEMGTGIIEQSLIIKTDKGLIVITGCAHPGIVEILEKAKELTGEKIYLAMGGFHLLNASASQIQTMITDFKSLEVEKLAPSHCTGEEARELLRQEYQDNFIENGVGKIIKL